MNAGEASDRQITHLFDEIYRQYCYDFRNYSLTSMRRRLKEALRQFDCADLCHLERRVLEDRASFTALVAHLTVTVTNLYRDPPFFLCLRDHVLPLLATYPTVRAWVAGCSTGEELYSLAILLAECGLLERAIIYGTDINPAALRTAREGRYPIDAVPAFAQNYRQSGGTGALSDHYTAAYGSIVFHRSLRDRVTVADHSLATDGVFAEVQLVTCRNVLIYFDRQLQDRAIGLFREALVRRGVLALGMRENLRSSRHARSFFELAPRHRIYQRL